MPIKISKAKRKALLIMIQPNVRFWPEHAVKVDLYGRPIRKLKARGAGWIRYHWGEAERVL